MLVHSGDLGSDMLAWAQDVVPADRGDGPEEEGGLHARAKDTAKRRQRVAARVDVRGEVREQPREAGRNLVVLDADVRRVREDLGESAEGDVDLVLQVLGDSDLGQGVDDSVGNATLNDSPDEGCDEKSW
jgi:hypothetical protein